MPTSLRSLLSSIEPPTTGNPNRVFYVSLNNDSAQNGGRCCLWTVPAGITRATFEIWGGGGDGGGGCCCQNAAVGAVGGSYATKSIDTVEGCQYRLCAASTGCCNYCCGVGTDGFPSYVYQITGASVIACAGGGQGGNMQPTWTSMANGYICCWGRLSTSGGIGDVVICGTGGTAIRSQFCHNQTYPIVSGGPFVTGRTSYDNCSGGQARSGDGIFCGYAPWPGGAGADGPACGGGFCWGSFGQSGVIKITYG